MTLSRKIHLYFNSNISEYNISIFDRCNSYFCQVNNLCTCVCIYTNQPFIDIYLSPKSNKYDSLCYRIYLIRNRCINLFVSFPEKTLYRTYFTLTDKNYNLPINGSLLINNK